MNRIKILPENLINQIAAGEVVERPASVVKELVENALDAGAKKIVIEIANSGLDKIKITDDGHGMSADDAKLAFERHATSKIYTTDDLFNIHTLGFRGEAIASIASVSKVQLRTKTTADIAGTLVKIEDGKNINVENCGCSTGTSIEVSELFFNVPARKKYLKNDSTEYGQILDVATGIALANPNVSFKLIKDDKIVFDLNATNSQLIRIKDLLGRQYADSLIPVFYGHSEIKLEGYVGKPFAARSNRKGQRIFVNGREVKSHVLSFAVKQSFYSLIPKEKHPVFVLFLNISPELVDVNVHPRKTEVRFKNEKEIFKIFINACSASLEKNVLMPEMQIDSASTRTHQPLKVEDKATVDQAMSFTIEMTKPVAANLNDNNEIENTPTSKDYEVPEKTAEFYQLNSDNADVTIIGQMDDSYILVQKGKELLIIDQHAAHERIQYKKLVDEFERKAIISQPLLAPIQFDLSPEQQNILAQNSELIANLGFEIENFGGNTFSIFAVPNYMVKQDVESTMISLLDDLADNAVKGDFTRRKEKALTYAACRSAIKFGDKISRTEQEALIKDLFKLELPYSCPHGRPTMFKITFDQLEKYFQRKNFNWTQE
ncbi:DNA mismatch repair endonuclease MutL [Candidatus Peregrinibacteria bacterium]|nr:DNA mismatch repair endonuclease MutL [Candidatus Peregrinibacteria bacterium]